MIPICPWCGEFVTDDAADLPDHGTAIVNCGACDGRVWVSAVKTVEYDVRKVEGPDQ